MKKLVYKLIHLFSRLWQFKMWAVFCLKCKAIRSEWIAAKMADCGCGVFFSKIRMLHHPEFIHIGSQTNFSNDLWLCTWISGGG